MKRKREDCENFPSPKRRKFNEATVNFCLNLIQGKFETVEAYYNKLENLKKDNPDKIVDKDVIDIFNEIASDEPQLRYHGSERILAYFLYGIFSIYLNVENFEISERMLFWKNVINVDPEDQNPSFVFYTDDRLEVDIKNKTSMGLEACFELLEVYKKSLKELFSDVDYSNNFHKYKNELESLEELSGISDEMKYVMDEYKDGLDFCLKMLKCREYQSKNIVSKIQEFVDNGFDSEEYVLIDKLINVAITERDKFEVEIKQRDVQKMTRTKEGVRRVKMMSPILEVVLTGERINEKKLEIKKLIRERERGTKNFGREFVVMDC